MKSFSRSFSAFSLAIAPALSMYDILPGTSLAGLLLLLSIMLSLTTGRVIVFKEAKLLLFGVLFLSALSFIINSGSKWFDNALFFHNLWSILVFLLPLVLLPHFLKLQVFIKTVLGVSILASFLVIFQKMQLLATGSFFDAFYLPLPMSEDVSAVMIRPHAFFKEPAHLSIYLLPALYLSLSMGKSFHSILFSLGILSCGSLTGFLMLGVIILYWFFSQYKKGSRLIIGLIVVLFSLFVIRFAPDLVSMQTERLASDSDNSTSVRLFGALDVLQKFDSDNFIFGIGFNQLGEFGRKVLGNSEITNYSNAVLFCIISFGFVGLFLLLSYLVVLYKSFSYLRGFFIVLVSILMSDQILFNANLTFLLSFIFLSNSIYNYCIIDNRESNN